MYGHVLFPAKVDIQWIPVLEIRPHPVQGLDRYASAFRHTGNISLTEEGEVEGPDLHLAPIDGRTPRDEAFQTAGLGTGRLQALRVGFAVDEFQGVQGGEVAVDLDERVRVDTLVRSIELMLEIVRTFDQLESSTFQGLNGEMERLE